MATDDLDASLEALSERLDFGEYESRAYLAVLRHGRLTASEIAEKADIPQPRVYDTVRALGDAGLVELQETRPMRVLALDPGEAFAGVRTTLDALVDGLEDVYTKPARGTEAASLVKSRSSIRRYLADVIDAAEYELLLSLSPDLLGRFEDAIRERREAGVSVELLLSPAADAPSAASYDYESLATAVRTRRGITTPVVTAADGTYAVYAPRDALIPDADADRYGVIFNRSPLGFLVTGFFNTLLWTTAETVAERADDRPFPRRYATIRRCVSDLRGRDGEFYATIRGRDVESGADRVVRGRIGDLTLQSTWETASLTVETDAGPVSVGGQVATLEDVEAHEILVGTDGPPAE